MGEFQGEEQSRVSGGVGQDEATQGLQESLGRWGLAEGRGAELGGKKKPPWHWEECVTPPWR